MSSIDERIVSLKFDNKQFQQGVTETQSALDKLKSLLRLDGAKQGLADVDKAAKGVDLSHIEKGVEGIQAKFSAMSVVAITALANIATAAFQTGTELIKSLTIDPVQQGFEEYELKMRSIQTILANTSQAGTELKDVDNALDELNKYADKTIYNFAEMTKNVGFFTNAGVGLKDSTALIKGFSNEAAASGTEAGAAAGAAYQLAQAFNSGVVRLMDWRSLTNVGMGSANMRKGLIDLADAMGKFNKDTTTAEAATKDFNSSLESKWLTTDVVLKYLKIQAGEVNEEQLRSLGLTEKQIDRFLTQAELADDAATKVRTWTQLIGTLQEAVGSGWTDTFNILIGDFDEATELFTAISDKVGGYLGKQAEQRNNTLRDWKEIGGRDELLRGLQNIGEAIIGVVKPIKQAFRDIFPRKTAEQLFELTKSFANFTEKLKIGEDTSNNIRRVFKGIFAIFSIVKTVVGSAIKYFADFWLILAGGTSGGILEFLAGIGDVIVAFDEWLKKGQYIENFFDKLIEGRRLVLEPIAEWVGTIIEAFGLLFSGDYSGFADKIGDSFQILIDVVNAVEESLNNTIAKIESYGNTASEKLQPVFEFLGQAGEKIVDVFNKIGGLSIDWPDFSGAADGLGDLGASGADAGSAIRNVVDWLKDAASNIGSWIKPFFEGVGEIASAVKDSLVDAFSDMEGLDWAAFINTGFFIAAYIAIKKFFNSFDDLIEAATEVIEGLGDTLKTFQHNVQATILLKIAAAVAILAASVWLMASIPADDLWRSLAGVGALLAAVVTTMIILTKLDFASKGGLGKVALALILISFAVNILANATSKLAGLDWEEMSRGLIATGALLLALGLFAKFADAQKMSVKGGVGLILLAVAIRIMAESVKTLGEMDTGQVIQGVAAIGALLAAVTGLSFVLGKYEGDLLKASVALLILSGALFAFSLVIERYAGMDLATFGIGLGLIAVSLVGIGVAMRTMPDDLPAKAAGILILAAALGVLSFLIEKLGNMDPKVLAIGVLAMAAALAVLVISVNAMSGTVTGVAGILAIVGAVWVLTGVIERLGEMDPDKLKAALIGLAVALGIFIAAGYLAAPIVPILLGLAAAIFLLGAAFGLIAIGVGMLALGLGLLATVGVAGVAAITLAMTAFLNMLPLLGQQLGLAFIAFLRVIEKSSPRIEAAMIALGTALLNAAEALIPKFGDVISQLIETGLDVLEKAIPDFVDTGYKILIGVLDGIADNIGDVVDSATDVAIAFIEAVGENALEFAEAGADVIIEFVSGLADMIDEKAPQMREAGADLAWAIINGLTGGLADGAINVINSITGMASNAWEAAKDFFESKSPSKLFMRLGRWNAEGLAIGIDKFGYKAARSTERMGAKSIEAMRKSISDLSSMVDEELNADPTIRPVLDLTEIQRQSGKLDGLLGSGTLNVAPSAGAATYAQNQFEDNLLAKLEAVTAARDVSPIQFVQNNTSPKALSSVEIYRQTHNQISTAKGVLAI